MSQAPRYWFPAKRFGWGWGFPVAWQGWLVLFAVIALMAAGAWIFPPGKSLAAYVAYVIVLSVVFFGICMLKGEPPRWRWG